MEIDFYEMFTSVKSLVNSEKGYSNEFIPQMFATSVLPTWYKDITAEELHILKTTNIYSSKEQISCFIGILQKIINLPEFSKSNITPLNYAPSYWDMYCNNDQSNKPAIPNDEMTETEDECSDENE